MAHMKAVRNSGTDNPAFRICHGNLIQEADGITFCVPVNASVDEKGRLDIPRPLGPATSGTAGPSKLRTPTTGVGNMFVPA